MIDQPQAFQPTPTTPSPGTALNQHVLTLFKTSRTTPIAQEPTVSLAIWALQSLAVNREWADAAAGAAAQAEVLDAQAVAGNLALPELLQAQTLEEAGLMMLALLADLIPEPTSLA